MGATKAWLIGKGVVGDTEGNMEVGGCGLRKPPKLQDVFNRILLTIFGVRTDLRENGLAVFSPSMSVGLANELMLLMLSYPKLVIPL
jgi:hypothetical protein